MLKQTKIVASISDMRCDVDFIKALFEAGMNVVRMNTAHASREGFEKLISNVREVSNRIAILMDTKGPEIRIRSFAEKTVELVAGAPFVLTTREVEGDCTCVGVTYSRLHGELEPGQEILIDDGLIAVRVEEICGQDILCRVENGGTLSSNKSLNIPGVHIRLPALTDKDVDDIRFGVEQGFDYIATGHYARVGSACRSFVGHTERGSARSSAGRPWRRAGRTRPELDIIESLLRGRRWWRCSRVLG